MNLWQLTNELELINQKIENNDGEISEEIEIELSKIAIDTQLKVDGCAEYVDYLNARIDMISERINQFNKLRVQTEKTLQSFSNYLIDCIEKSDGERLQGKLRYLKVRKPSKKVEIINEKLVPINFFTRKEEIILNKKAIAEALKSGDTVEGARLIDGEKSLIIK